MTPEKQNHPLLGEPVLVGGKTYIIRDKAVVGKSYTVVCPVCGQHMETTPAKKGPTLVKCPNHDSVIGYNAKAEQAGAQTVAPPRPLAGQSHPLLGEPVLVGGKTYIIHDKAVVGKSYTVVCPVCGQHMETTPVKKGPALVKCPNHDSVIGYNATSLKKKKSKGKAGDDGPVETEHGVLPSLRHNGCLEWGGFLSKKRATLHVGTNTIGRKDLHSPSDISFKDDYMSRQSATIDVEKDPNRSGYTFKFTLLRASNPVFVGSHQLLVGNSIYLNYGDTIKLGTTTLIFQEDQTDK